MCRVIFPGINGLLKGRKCAIHWAAKNEFQAMFPEVTIIDDTIITDEGGIYTCGGGYSYLNLLLYIIEKHLGREMSILASKMFEIDIERKNQNQFIIFMGQKRHEDKNVLSAQEFIENNPTETYLPWTRYVQNLMSAAEHLKESLKNARAILLRNIFKGLKSSLQKSNWKQIKRPSMK